MSETYNRRTFFKRMTQLAATVVVIPVLDKIPLSATAKFSRGLGPMSAGHAYTMHPDSQVIQLGRLQELTPVNHFPMLSRMPRTRHPGNPIPFTPLTISGKTDLQVTKQSGNISSVRSDVSSTSAQDISPQPADGAQSNGVEGEGAPDRAERS